MNEALSLVPAKVRLALYLAYAVAGLVVSSVAVYATAVGSTTPSWDAGAAAVLGALAAPFGAMAGSNINKPAAAPAPAPDPAPADGAPVAP